MDLSRLILDNLLVLIFFILTLIAFIVAAIRNKRPEPVVPPEICGMEKMPDGENFVRCPVCRKVNEFPLSEADFVEIKCLNCGARLGRYK